MPCKDPDHMECPCLCECGEWFELHDGWAKPGSTKIVCRDCYENAEQCANCKGTGEIVDEDGEGECLVCDGEGVS